jgi:hypothetical protein
MRHWCPYLWGRSFLIKTDHYSLKFLLDQRLSTIPQQQWASKLLGIDFHVEFKPVAMNVVAGALPHHDAEEAVTMVLSCTSFQLSDDWRREMEDTSDLRVHRDEAVAGTRGAGWRVHNDLLLVIVRVYLLPTSACLHQVLTAAHSVGHEGIAKTLHQLHAYFHVLDARTLVIEFVRACATC